VAEWRPFGGFSIASPEAHRLKENYQIHLMGAKSDKNFARYTGRQLQIASPPAADGPRFRRKFHLTDTTNIAPTKTGSNLSGIAIAIIKKTNENLGRTYQTL
jgi:hypothetical protein